MNSLQPIENILECPACRGKLHINREQITCAACNQIYPIHDGIPQFAIIEDDAAVAEQVGALAENSYQQRYEDFENARNYNLKYDRKFLKRLSTRREHQILQRLLRRQPHSATMLEIPCGGGRISPQLESATDVLIQADAGLGQILYGMTRDALRIPQVWMTANAFHIPLRDSSVDAVVCIRLSHHLPANSQREALLAELLRVARGYVIMTFFDYHSVKNTLRRLKAKRPKLTMKLSRVSSIAAAHGATLVACPRLAMFGSGHRYALMVKTQSV